jgi:hypothetical protein
MFLYTMNVVSNCFFSLVIRFLNIKYNHIYYLEYFTIFRCIHGKIDRQITLHENIKVIKK